MTTTNSRSLQNPLVSVIIPVYNHENYVEEALNSIFYQTYTNLEVIIIDDGSKDESVKQVEKCIESWKKCGLSQSVTRDITFIKQSNCGASETINLGLSMAKGEFLTILNSDDYYHLQRLETFVQQTLLAHTKFAFSYVVGINETCIALPSHHWWSRWYEKSKTRLFRYPSIGFLLLQENFAVSTGNLFFTKELYKEVGPFNHFKLTHDLDFILRAIILTDPLLIRENLYYYRLHKTNTQYSVKHLMKEELKAIYRTYLTQIASPPKNLLAPCHWYWPLDFARLRLQLKMDNALDDYIVHSHADDSDFSLLSLEKKNESLQKNLIPKQLEKLAFRRCQFFKLFGYKTICLVTHDLGLTGAPKVVCDLAILLKQRGYKIKVISLQDGPMKAELEKRGIIVKTTKGNFLKKIVYFIYLACFKTSSLTLVNSIASWPFVCLLALFHPFRTIKWYIHESTIPRTLDGRISFSLFKWFKCKRSRTFWFGSESTKETWKVHVTDGEVLYWSGIPANDSNIKSSTRPLKEILSVGTASARKGTYYLIDAFLNCLESKLIPDDVILTIVGFPKSGTPDFIGLEDLILRVVTSKFRKNIQLIGMVSPKKLELFYQNADLFIQSSILECLPLSLLTAMSQGLPIITTNVNGCKEAIQHQHNGYVCLPYSSLSLKDSIVEAINNPEKSREMGIRARQAFNERFSIEVTEPVLIEKLHY